MHMVMPPSPGRAGMAWWYWAKVSLGSWEPGPRPLLLHALGGTTQDETHHPLLQAAGGHVMHQTNKVAMAMAMALRLVDISGSMWIASLLSASFFGSRASVLAPEAHPQRRKAMGPYVRVAAGEEKKTGPRPAMAMHMRTLQLEYMHAHAYTRTLILWACLVIKTQPPAIPHHKPP